MAQAITRDERLQTAKRVEAYLHVCKFNSRCIIPSFLSQIARTVFMARLDYIPDAQIALAPHFDKLQHESKAPQLDLYFRARSTAPSRSGWQLTFLQLTDPTAFVEKMYLDILDWQNNPTLSKPQKLSWKTATRSAFTWDTEKKSRKQKYIVVIKSAMIEERREELFYSTIAKDTPWAHFRESLRKIMLLYTRPITVKGKQTIAWEFLDGLSRPDLEQAPRLQSDSFTDRMDTIQALESQRRQKQVFSSGLSHMQTMEVATVDGSHNGPLETNYGRVIAALGKVRFIILHLISSSFIPSYSQEGAFNSERHAFFKKNPDAATFTPTAAHSWGLTIRPSEDAPGYDHIACSHLFLSHPYLH
jgi:hypothetical protein